MIHSETIDPDNRRTDLKVREDQRYFVAERAVSLARAYAYRDSRSRAFIIYNDEEPVGMALYYDLDEEEEYDFSQFFIDERYQGNGYGYEVASLILQMMKDDGRYDKVVLCYIEGDEPARKLYEKLGFRHTGEQYEDEIIMEMYLR